MLHLYTEPDKFTQLMGLVDGSVRNPTDGDLYFNDILARLNATGHIITLASSTGQPHVKSKQMLYIHMAVSRDGADMVARLFQQAQKQIHHDWECDNQPSGLTLKPTALQLRFNYYHTHGMWLQAMTIQCHGIVNSAAQNYVVKVLRDACR